MKVLHPASVSLLSIAGSVVSMRNLIGILEKNGIKKKFILLWKSNMGVSYFRSGQYIFVSRKRMHGILKNLSIFKVTELKLVDQ